MSTPHSQAPKSGKPAPLASRPVRRRAPTLEIRPARREDYPTVIALLDAAHLPHCDLTPEHLDEFLLAERGERLEGVVGLEGQGEARLLRSLAVAERAQGAGLGHLLMEAAEARARAQGASRLWLLTTTAEPFFARAGYLRAERDTAPKALRLLTEFASVCPSTAACMTKMLD
ncbi:MAG: arsenic resistance N-acetyltransferase ArsN2 [Stagnimonas sp.]|nr:arsenic resistance N-acetyltransferase ArsN2 [Stagnimonas sp.]